MDSHREAHHIYRLDDVCRPVASLLVRLDLVNDHIMLLLTVGRNIERRKEHLAAVLHAGEEVNDIVLLLTDTLLLLDTICNALDLEDVIPEGVGNLYVVLDGRGVAKLRFLCHADELLDVIPLALE